MANGKLDQMRHPTFTWLRTNAPAIALLLAIGAAGGVTANPIHAHAIRSDFYLAVATIVPIILLAVVVRLGSWGEEAVNGERESLAAALEVSRLSREVPDGDEEFVARLTRLRDGLMPLTKGGRESAVRVLLALTFLLRGRERVRLPLLAGFGELDHRHLLPDVRSRGWTTRAALHRRRGSNPRAARDPEAANRGTPRGRRSPGER